MSENMGEVRWTLGIDATPAEQGAGRAADAIGNVIDRVQKAGDGITSAMEGASRSFGGVDAAAKKTAASIRQAMGGDELKQYAATIDALKFRIQAYTEEQARLTGQMHQYQAAIQKTIAAEGERSDRAKQLADEIANQEEAIRKAEGELQVYRQTLDEVKESEGQFSESAKQAGMSVFEEQVRLVGLEETLKGYKAELQEVIRAEGEKSENTRRLIDEMQSLEDAYADLGTGISEMQGIIEEMYAVYDAHMTALENTQPVDEAAEAARRLAEETEAAAAATAAAQSQMTNGLGAAATAFQSLGRASGGAMGNISAFAMQLRTLNAAFKSSQAAGAGLATTMSMVVAGVGLAVMAISLIVNALEEEKKAKKEAYDAAVKYMDQYKKESVEAAHAVKVLGDNASATDDVRAAKNKLAQLFPDLVVGWTDEGDAILAGNEAIEKRMALLREEAEFNRGETIRNMNKDWDEYAEKVRVSNVHQQELKEGLARFAAAGGDYIEGMTKRWTDLNQAIAGDETGGTIFKSYDFETLEKNAAEAKKKLSDMSDELDQGIRAMVEKAIDGFDDLSAAQKYAVDEYVRNAQEEKNAHAESGAALEEYIAKVARGARDIVSNKELIAEAERNLAQEQNTSMQEQIALLDEKGKAEEQSAAAYLAALQRINDTYAKTTDEQMKMDQKLNVARRNAMNEEIAALEHRKRMAKISNDEYIKGLEEINEKYKKNAKDQMDMDYKLKQARDEAYDFSGAYNELERLAKAYETLNKGEQLSIQNLTELIKKYPVIAEHIAKNGDLSLRNGQIIKELFEAEQAEMKAKLEGERAKAVATLNNTNARIEAIKKEIEALQALARANAATYQAMSSAAKSYADGAMSGLKIMTKEQVEQSIALSKQRIAAEDAAKAAASSIKEIDALLKTVGLATMSGMSGGSGGSGGGKGGASKAKKETQEVINYYKNALEELEYLRSMERVTTAQYLEGLIKINATYKKTLEEQRAMDIKMFQTRRELIEEQMTADDRALEHKRRMGGDTVELLREEIKMLKERRAITGLLAEQKMDIEERLYQARKDLVQAAMDTDDRALEHRRRTGEDTVKILKDEIKMLEKRLKLSNLAQEQLMEIEERLFQSRKDLRQAQMDMEDRLLEHRRKTGEDTKTILRDEIRMLEKRLKSTENTVEQIMDIEERLVAAKIALRNEELGGVDRMFRHMERMGMEYIDVELSVLRTRLANYEMTLEEMWALEERIYSLEQKRIAERQKAEEAANKARIKAEQDRLNAMIASWRAWENEVTKSIDAYIDALRKLKQEEDRADQDREQQRKINATKLALAYEQDAYNREKLQRELQKLEDEQTKRERDRAIDDQISALQESKNAIRELSRERQDAIKAESDAVKDGIIKISGATQGKESQIMRDVENQMSAIGSAYKSEFADLGTTLGKSISETLKSSLEKAMDNFLKMTQGYTDKIKQAASGYATALGGDIVDINQYRAGLDTRPITVNFYGNVDSPYEMLKALEDINRRLAAGIL